MLVLNKKFKLILLLLILVSCFAVFFYLNSTEALAQISRVSSLDANIVKVQSTIATVSIISYVLMFLCLIALGFLIYGIILWKKTYGDEELIARAKKVLWISGIALAVLLISLIISLLVKSSLKNQLTQQQEELDEIITQSLLYNDIFKISSINTACGNLQQTHKDVYLCSNLAINFNRFLDALDVELAIKNNELKIEKCNDEECLETSDPEFYPAEYIESLPTGKGSEWYVNQRSINFLHEILFAKNTQYKLTLPKTLRDESGEMLDESNACQEIDNCFDRGENYVWIFETGEKNDDQAPKITSAFPRLQDSEDYPQKEISLSPIIWAKFSESIAPWSVNQQNIKIRKVNNIDLVEVDSSGELGEEISDDFIVSVNLDGDGFEISNLNLESFTWYEIDVSDVMDMCNNSMQNKSWRFQTGEIGPGVKKVYPSNGYAQACPNTDVFIEFNTSMYNIETGECKVSRSGKNGGHVLSGSMLPEVKRKLQVEDDFLGGNLDPNQYCKIYRFLPDSLELKANQKYSVGVNTNLTLNNKNYLNYGDIPPANTPSAGNWSFSVLPYDECVNQTGGLSGEGGQNGGGSGENNESNQQDKNKYLNVIESSRCVINEQIKELPSPNPYKNASNVCLNSLISVRFDNYLKDNKLDFDLYKCGGSVLDPCGSAENLIEISGNLKIIDLDQGIGSFKFIPEQNLEKGNFYKAVINQAEGVDGKELKAPYSWIFETSNSTQCQVQAVALNPRQSYLNKIGDKVDFVAGAIGKNCAELVVDEDWQWQIEDSSVASTTNSTSNTETVTALGDGTTYLSAEIFNISQQAKIIVRDGVLAKYCDANNDTAICEVNNTACNDPDYPICDPESCICIAEPVTAPAINILQFSPRGTQNCTNLVASVVFDKKLKSNTIDKSNNVALWQAENKVASSLDIQTLAQGEGVCNTIEGCTQVKIYPENILNKGTTYTLKIKGGLSGVRAEDTAILAEDQVKNSSFTINNSGGVCTINKIEINPERYTFTRSGLEKQFQIKILGTGNQEITRVPDIYNWQYDWDKIDVENIISITNSKQSHEVVRSNNKNGSATLKVTVSVVTDIISQTEGKEFVKLAKIENRLCQNPWPVNGQPYRDTSGYSNFSMFYCRDKGGGQKVCTAGENVGLSCSDNSDCPGGSCADADDLPGLLIPRIVESGPDALREYLLLRDDDSTDAIGIRVFDNSEHLSPQEWYVAQDFKQEGSLKTTTVDGYEALEVGRSIYVFASTLSGNNKIYTNVYLFSHSQNASSETLEIFTRLLNNLRFNINLTDYQVCSDNTTFCTKDSDCSAGQTCNADKSKLIRDVQRLTDLSRLRSYLNDFQQANGYYPKLISGSYQIGKSNSAWPSWNQTLGNALGQTLDVDPINEFNLPCSSTNNEKYDQATCWNDEDKIFMCPNDSYVYHYSTANGTNFQIYGNMEYRGQGSLVNENNSNTCWNYAIFSD